MLDTEAVLWQGDLLALNKASVVLAKTLKGQAPLAVGPIDYGSSSERLITTVARPPRFTVVCANWFPPAPRMVRPTVFGPPVLVSRRVVSKRLFSTSPFVSFVSTSRVR